MIPIPIPGSKVSQGCSKLCHGKFAELSSFPALTAKFHYSESCATGFCLFLDAFEFDDQTIWFLVLGGWESLEWWYLELPSYKKVIFLCWLHIKLHVETSRATILVISNMVLALVQCSEAFEKLKYVFRWESEWTKWYPKIKNKTARW